MAYLVYNLIEREQKKRCSGIERERKLPCSSNTWRESNGSTMFEQQNSSPIKWERTTVFVDWTGAKMTVTLFADWTERKSPCAAREIKLEPQRERKRPCSTYKCCHSAMIIRRPNGRDHIRRSHGRPCSQIKRSEHGTKRAATQCK